MFKRVLIANRGEIACRIIRGCREMGCETVAVYSEPDSTALHVRLADEARLLGPAAASESYLKVQRILEVARETGCDSVHPGYGFLAENAGFAKAVAEAGLCWIGPPPEVISGMGLKIEAREMARQAGAPVVPGFEEPDSGEEEFLAAADAMGYPVMVKASAGGGGKGMRTVTGPEQLIRAIEAARREAAGAFGDATVYLEKLIVDPRHIEIQVLCDNHGNAIHLGERECSIQRRHQKVVEETPSTAVTPKLRRAMGESAVKIAREVGYCGAGTVEFMVDPTGNYYFLEMNTRLQVEHPVTELVYGIDLVHWQLKVAAGEVLDIKQEDIAPRGHSIEVRVCAEDPAAGFLPAVGTVEAYQEPAGPGVRLDTMLYDGWEVGADYDPLLGKLIVWAPDRPAAITRMAQALRDYRVLGVTTNLAFLHDVINHEAFASGDTTTAFIGEYYPQWKTPEAGEASQLAAVLALATRRSAMPTTASAVATNGEIPTAWQSLGDWSNV